ncbi:hypothetical protein EW093_16250 [Thiospirochaeta perfilievii]|uniref:LapA family protein n=1 Tax=Thiospirochaeta perfilievii TaxID=252967 RepID=A0A5C1QF71_9SPIO|nr:hypothetical protein [Thiospirochaeta perfilievii]QEN06171.1 hypothetical protein EW093_16250 [Thiospirochaeta perfilievii]
MIRRFFIQIIIISFIVCFFGLNFDTKVSIRFWFNDALTFNNISLFISLAVSYLLGVVTFLPFYIAKNFKSRKKEKEKGTVIKNIEIDE